MSSPWALAFSGSRRKYRLGRRRTRADGDGTDGRDPPLAVPRLLNGRLAPRGIRARSPASSLEARTRRGRPSGPCAASACSQDPGQFLTSSWAIFSALCAAWLCVAASGCSSSAAPSDDLAHVLGVVSDGEMSLDQHGDAVSGPELGAGPPHLKLNK